MKRYKYFINFACSEDFQTVDLILQYINNGIVSSMEIKDNKKYYYLLSDHKLTISDISSFSRFIDSDIIIDEEDDRIFVYNDYIE